MAVRADIQAVLDDGRDDLVLVLAKYQLVPTVVDRGGGSSLLGRSTSPTVKLEAQSDETGTVDRQTTARVVVALGRRDGPD